MGAALLEIGAGDGVKIGVLGERREQDDVGGFVPADGAQRRDLQRVERHHLGLRQALLRCEACFKEAWPCFEIEEKKRWCYLIVAFADNRL